MVPPRKASPVIALLSPLIPSVLELLLKGSRERLAIGLPGMPEPQTDLPELSIARWKMLAPSGEDGVTAHERLFI